MDDRRNRRFIGAVVLLGTALQVNALLTSPALAQMRANNLRDPAGAETITPLPDLTTTSAGEPLLYLDTPNPVISSDILTIPPGGVSRWMTHPVPAYVYVLQGALTVQFMDGKEKTVREGEVLLQPRAVWHRGRNEGHSTLRFLAVFFGAKGVPGILHPPSGPLVGE
jgi:quercetin dioxygenase-like cupin family protein